MKNQIKLLAGLFLLLSLPIAYAQEAPTTPILGGVLQSDLNAAGHDVVDAGNLWTRDEADARYAPTGVVDRVESIEMWPTGNWNEAHSWGPHAAAGYASTGALATVETNLSAHIQELENDKADLSNVWTRAESDARFAPTGVVERVDAIETNYFQKTGGTINGTVTIPNHRLLANRIGIDSGYLSTGFNMYFGNFAGYSAAGNNNMYIGPSAGLMSTNANHSMFIGRYAGKNALDKTYWMFIDHHVAYDPAFDPVDSSIAIDGSTATATLYLGRPEGSTRIRGNFYLPGGGLLTSDGTNLFFVTSDGSITNALTSN